MRVSGPLCTPLTSNWLTTKFLKQRIYHCWRQFFFQIQKNPMNCQRLALLCYLSILSSMIEGEERKNKGKRGMRFVKKI